MVELFEWRAGTLVRLGEANDLIAASSGLPHGAYTSLRTHRGNRVVRLSAHVSRLVSSVAAGPELLEDDVRRALAATLGATRLPESRLRLTWAPPRLFLAVEPFVTLPEALYEQGVACATLSLHRSHPEAKDTRFIASAAEAYAHLPTGVHEGLMVGEDGVLLEGLTSNVFVITGGTLRTEAARALPGITRGLVLEVAAGVLPVRQAGVPVAELPQAGEAFLTSVSRGVLPVAAIDGRPVGGGGPGPLTREIRRRFEALVEREAEPVG